MRIKLRHSLRYDFPDATRNVALLLRLTPRSHEGQRVSDWRLDVEPDCLLKAGEDHFGNLTHALTIPGPADFLQITVRGEISNFGVSGLVRGTAERLPTELYLRDTAMTLPNAELRDFARDSMAGTPDRIAALHALMGVIHERIAYDDTRANPSPAQDVFAAKSGNCQDLAHVFTACARSLGIPTRCVTGYLLPEDGRNRRHAWAESFVDGLGWIGFDAVNDVCPEERHIRLATGLDASEGAAVRGIRLSDLKEKVAVRWLMGGDASDTRRETA